MSISSTKQRQHADLERLREAASVGGTAAKQLIPAIIEVLCASCSHDDVAGLLNDSLALVASATGCEYVALARLDEGRWLIEGETGKRHPLPKDLLVEVLDRESTQSDGSWIAAPLAAREAAKGVLVAHVVKPTNEVARTLDALAAALAAALANARSREQKQRRTEQLETILRLAAQWNQTHEMVPLLEQMAEAATRLLHADRASIFLWDKPNRTLVGRHWASKEASW